MSIYEEMKQAEIEIDHHDSNLYVKDCVTSRAIMVNHGYNPEGMTPYSWINRLDGSKWYDLPFQYEPFWS